MKTLQNSDIDFSHKEGVALKDYFDSKITDLETALRDKFETQDRALDLATTQLEKRLGLLNELRGNVLSKEEYEAKHLLLETKIENLQKIIYIATGAFLILDYIIKFVK